MVSANSLALATTVGLVAISSAVLFAPAGPPAPRVDVVPAARKPLELELQVGRVQVRWLPKDDAAQATAMPPQDGINHLSRAAVVVAAVTLVILGITFLQSVFEAHAGELAALEERVAESKKAEDALAAEIVSIKASMLEAEGKLRTNMLAVALAKTVNKLEARGQLLQLKSVFGAWKRDAADSAQRSAQLQAQLQHSQHLKENKRVDDEMLRTQILGSLDGAKLNRVRAARGSISFYP